MVGEQSFFPPNLGENFPTNFEWGKIFLTDFGWGKKKTVQYCRIPFKMIPKPSEHDTKASKLLPSGPAGLQ